jgi:hypothetical protein
MGLRSGRLQARAARTREVGRLGVILGNQCGAEVSIPPPEVCGAIDSEFDCDLVPGADSSGLLLPDLVPPVLEAKGEIASHTPRPGFSEEDLRLRSLRQGPAAVFRIRRLDGEALVPEGDPEVFKKLVRCFNRGDPLDPHLLDQPVLSRAEVTFDSALSLRGQGADQLDIELPQPAPDNGLRGSDPPTRHDPSCPTARAPPHPRVGAGTFCASCLAASPSRVPPRSATAAAYRGPHGRSPDPGTGAPPVTSA